MRTVHGRLSDIFIIQAGPMRSSSNTISPSASIACKQRLRGFYGNVYSGKVLCTSTIQEESCVVHYSPQSAFRGNPFVDLDAFNHCLYIYYTVNLQQSNILDIQRAETFRDKTSIIQRQCNMKVTAVASWKCLTGREGTAVRF